ncbi:copper homeostasis protein [Companilactobacillus sp. RD055328]|uniref:copper homeostasis protein CutC n=1 Tax=Companilactobacillus sp. RD055328 TaxID=2916634 RepID=UPI0020845B66|nr:copper homeostasis protein CutC [Companilactobacillus sp. RD055328]GKQ43079.1 copper homeostasis protein [Companilactobacillus sp. RD055328]
MILKEVAVENYSNIPAAVMAGANRIELNDNLAVGGTTVSYGVMAEAAKYLQEKQVPLTVMIRPRGGNFVYNDIELKIMEADIFKAQELGVDAVTFGCLTTDGNLDEEAMEMLIGASSGMDIVMHMAFDDIDEANQTDVIDWLEEHDVKRILTHGGDLTKPLNVKHLQELIKLTEGKNIDILPGGGITFENIEGLTKELNVPFMHGTKIVKM